jgi:hypothetical protein
MLCEGGWTPGPVWTGAENLAPPPPGFDPQTVQPVASRYTVWAIFRLNEDDKILLRYLLAMEDKLLFRIVSAFELFIF